MPDREKVIKELHDARRYLEDKEWSDRCASPHIDAINDALAMIKEQAEVEPQDAEMLIIHNGGAEEYVKDIESIVLLAHKDYDIVYCGTF